jgi:hypothetical protein
MHIIDGFLKEEDFKKLSDVICGSDFPWYATDGITLKGDGKFQFTHMFYEDGKPMSNWWGLVMDTLKHWEENHTLEHTQCLPIKMKVNCGTKTTKHEESDFHHDVGIKNHKYHTGILYLNNNNGYTEFKDGDKVESVANRFVSFDGITPHRSVSQTDTNFRYVINLNWIEMEIV